MGVDPTSWRTAAEAIATVDWEVIASYGVAYVFKTVQDLGATETDLARLSDRVLDIFVRGDAPTPRTHPVAPNQPAVMLAPSPRIVSPIGLRVDQRAKAVDELINVLAERWRDGSLSFDELLEKTPKLLARGVLPQAWDGNGLYPSRVHLLPRRTATRLDNTAYPRVAFFEALSLCRYVLGAKSSEPGAADNLLFLDVFLQDAARRQVSDRPFGGTARVAEAATRVMTEAYKMRFDLLPPHTSQALSLGLGIKVQAFRPEIIKLAQQILEPPYKEQAALALRALLSPGGALQKNPALATRLLALGRQKLPDIATARIAAQHPNGDPSRRLLMDTLRILAFPHTVHQGQNPTCQSVRGIYLLAEHEPSRLLDSLFEVLKKGDLTTKTTYGSVSSQDQDTSLNTTPPVDALSAVLVPHLHANYLAMVKQSISNQSGSNVHATVNRDMYGKIVLGNQYSSRASGAGNQADAAWPVITHFYQVFHPDLYRTNPTLPMSVEVTLPGAKHAIVIERIEKDPRTKETRVFFMNPRLDDEHQWTPLSLSTWAYGERPGEVSLSFFELASVVEGFAYDESWRGNGSIPVGDKRKIASLLGTP